jgi:hypothetical protein
MHFYFTFLFKLFQFYITPIIFYYYLKKKKIKSFPNLRRGRELPNGASPVRPNKGRPVFLTVTKLNFSFKLFLLLIGAF